MASWSRPAPAGPQTRVARVASRVSTIELLFDLVFVFTMSRVAEIVVHRPDAAGVAQGALVLALVWWMYDAFAWLTNQAAPDSTGYRIALIGAMAAFLVMSLAIPDAFGSTGVLFGVSYIVVAVIHAALFIALGGAAAGRRMIVVGTSNVLVGVLLVVSGFVEGPLDWVLFTVPLLLFLASALLSARGGFDPGASHMVERHGLLMIIAFGESIVSVGVGATEHEIGASLLVGTVLAVALVSALWWCYFDGDDTRAEARMNAVAPARRTGVALLAFYLEHLAMIFGLLLLAAGLHGLFVDPFAPLEPADAWLIGGGVALYLAGDAAYRGTLDLGPVATRLVAAPLAAATAWVGIAVAGAWQPAALLAVVVAVLVVENARRSPALPRRSDAPA
ncbi:low temperature requirement protein A [Microbacterium sp. B2969]|uniref:Low temperature requirement protein A n=1 Tax=Microbacterium alkaliflavum TaxID=3248839 RepID=A0ABW7Q6J1_9MICO